MYQNFIGIDIGKDNFFVAVDNVKKIGCFDNSDSGFNLFCQAYSQYLPDALTIIETTGGYEIALIEHLQKLNYKVHRANTRKVKHFIRSFGQLGKSDAIDARALANYGGERHKSLKLFVPNPRKILVKLAQRRLDLKQMLVQEKNRLKAPDQKDIKNSFVIIIQAIEDQVAAIDEQIKSIYEKEPTLSEEKEVLKTIPGIGEIIAFELQTLLPELGKANRKQIASLAGVAPHPNESGKKVGYRPTRGGRQDVKSILFLAALSAARGKSELGEFYRRLVESGKKKMVALVAVMRKIVVIANARMRDYFIEKEITTT